MKKPFRVELRIDRELIAIAPDPKTFVRRQLEKFYRKTLQEIETCPLNELIGN